MLLRPPYTLGISRRLYLRWIDQKAPGQIPYRCYRRGCLEWPNIHPKGRRVSVTDTDACRLDVSHFHLLQILIVFLTPFLRYSCYQFMVKIKNCISIFGQKFFVNLSACFAKTTKKPHEHWKNSNHAAFYLAEKMGFEPMRRLPDLLP